MPSRKAPADLRLFYLQRAPPPLPTVRGIQTYFPSLEQLFPSLQTSPVAHPTLAATELLVDVSGDGIATVENLLTHEKRQQPVWMRTVHLVEPVSVMDGSYVLPGDGALPAPRAPWQAALRKLNDPYNEAYTDAVCACMLSRLVETKRSPHFCRFFGTYAGRVPEYAYNITDEMQDIQEEEWFKEGLHKGAYQILAVDAWDPNVTAALTQPWAGGAFQRRASIGETTSDLGSSSDLDEDLDEDAEKEVDDESTEKDSGSTATSALEDSLAEEDDIPVSGSVTLERPRLRLQRLSPASEGSASTAESEDDLEYRAILPNFPVQISVLERCDGTMDQLMEDELDAKGNHDMEASMEARWTAWLFQVIAGLTTAQQAYDFIHNDLHTNNVMWTGTGETQLYYHVKGGQGGDRFYRVPTYGRIMKIIDFGRATFRPPAAANGNRLWISDAFAPEADAGGQYNCGPYFDQSQPKVMPNKSFDLCRLAVSILDTLWEGQPPAVQPRRVLTREPGRTTHETTSPLWNLLWLWLTDRHGKNILLTPTGEERYPNFDLYCAIAADAQNAVPAQQLTLPLFDSAFRCRRRDIPADAQVWTLHAVSKQARQ